MRAAIVGMIAAICLVAGGARAITVENYQKYRLDATNLRATYKSLLEVRMEGVLQGMLLVNRSIAAGGGKPLFCAPDTLQMRGSEVLKLLDDEITSGRTADGKPYPGSALVEDALLAMALKRWPCAR